MLHIYRKMMSWCMGMMSLRRYYFRARTSRCHLVGLLLCVCARVCVCMCVYVLVRGCVCMCVYICLCVLVCVCVVLCVCASSSAHEVHNQFQTQFVREYEHALASACTCACTCPQIRSQLTLHRHLIFFSTCNQLIFNVHSIEENLKPCVALLLIHTLIIQNANSLGESEPYTYTVYDRILGDFPAQNTVYLHRVWPYI